MDDKKKVKNKSKNRSIYIAGILIAIAIVTILLFFINGRATLVKKNNLGPTEHFLACTTEKIAYPYFTYDNSVKKKININVTFLDDNLSSISLVYDLTYANEQEAKDSELKNHIDFEIALQNEGLTYASVNSDHQVMDEIYQLTLYNSANEINNKTAKYYFLEELNQEDDYTIDDVAKAITAKGLDCKRK